MLVTKKQPYSQKKKRNSNKNASPSEKYIQRRILDWLKKTGLLHWRQNSGKVRVAGARFNRFILLGKEGLPDIIVIAGPNGRVVGLEVKSKYGVQRPSQKALQADLEASGGLYFIVRSLEDAQNAVAKALGEELWRALQLSLTKVRKEKSCSVRSKQQKLLQAPAVTLTWT